MRVERAIPGIVKGWYLGPWNSELAISLGYATEGLNEPHLHQTMSEVYMVARGASERRVGDQTVSLTAGDIVVVEPGEPHTLMCMSTLYNMWPVGPGRRMRPGRSWCVLVSSWASGRLLDGPAGDCRSVL